MEHQPKETAEVTYADDIAIFVMAEADIPK